MTPIIHDILLDEIIRELKRSTGPSVSINMKIAKVIEYGSSSTVAPPNWTGDFHAALIFLPKDYVWSVGWDNDSIGSQLGYFERHTEPLNIP